MNARHTAFAGSPLAGVLHALAWGGVVRQSGRAAGGGRRRVAAQGVPAAAAPLQASSLAAAAHAGPPTILAPGGRWLGIIAVFVPQGRLMGG